MALPSTLTSLARRKPTEDKEKTKQLIYRAYKTPHGLSHTQPQTGALAEILYKGF